MAVRTRSEYVFLNCPFDTSYKPLFEAIVFTISCLDFKAKCALEVDDASKNRLDKIAELIEVSRYGIHDISAVGLDSVNGLPRFNMPLELGLFLGCKRFGHLAQLRKSCLILDSEPYRYQKFISDIAGQDLHSHGGSAERAIVEVRNWLCAASRRKGLPGGASIVERYSQFRADLPALCRNLGREEDALTFTDWIEMISIWLQPIV